MNVLIIADGHSINDAPIEDVADADLVILFPDVLGTEAHVVKVCGHPLDQCTVKVVDAPVPVGRKRR